MLPILISTEQEYEIPGVFTMAPTVRQNAFVCDGDQVASFGQTDWTTKEDQQRLLKTISVVLSSVRPLNASLPQRARPVAIPLYESGPQPRTLCGVVVIMPSWHPISKDGLMRAAATFSCAWKEASGAECLLVTQDINTQAHTALTKVLPSLRHSNQVRSECPGQLVQSAMSVETFVLLQDTVRLTDESGCTETQAVDLLSSGEHWADLDRLVPRLSDFDMELVKLMPRIVDQPETRHRLAKMELEQATATEEDRPSPRRLVM